MRLFLFCVAALVVSNLCRAADENPLFPPSEAGFAVSMGGKDIVQILQTAAHIDAVRVHADEKDRANIISLGDSVALDEAAAKKARKYFGDRNSYFDGASACIFEPAVKLIFHPGKGDAIELVICLQCGDAKVFRAGQSIGSASFARTLDELIRLAQFIFPKDKDIGDLVTEQEAVIKTREDNDARWRAGMPKSIQPLWKPADVAFMNPDEVAPFRKPLVMEFPDMKQRILALLKWYGSGAGPWSGFPSYEEAVELLLMEYSTQDLLSVIDPPAMSEEQVEGAARLFAGWTFRQKRPNDNRLIPKRLKQALLAHSMNSSDEDKRARARKAFGMNYLPSP
jgi:hypothetical protein